MKLGLGTVQFGINYGISNKAGIPTGSEISAILETAAVHGIHCLDTAALYGDSEAALGKALPGKHAFQIVTKTAGDFKQVGDSFERSLERLGQDSVYALLVHNADDLRGSGGELLFKTLQQLKSSGRVRKIGVSVYSSAQIEAVLKIFPIEIIQLPFNMLDQRLLASGKLAELKNRQIEIHSRSTFLQGLLLMPPGELPSRFATFRGSIQRIHAEVTGHGFTMLEAALAFVLTRPEIDRALVGVTSRAQLVEILGAAEKSTAAAKTLNFAGFAQSEEALLNPALWVKHA